MRLYKRGRTYWFELEFEGKRYRESRKVKNRTKAEGIAAKFRTSLAEGRVGIVERKPAPTFEKAMAEFLQWSKDEHQDHPNTHKRYATSSKPLLRFLRFKGTPVDRFTAAMVEEYKALR